MIPWSRMRIGAVLILLLPGGQVLAQQSAQVELVIQQGAREIGREEFSLRQGRGRGAPGTTLQATAWQPPKNPTRRLAAVLERTPEAALAKFQLDVEGPGGNTVILAVGSGARLIIRTVAKGSEAGRELPGGPDVVLLDEDVYSLYIPIADLATANGKALTGVYPRTARRVSFVARRQGPGVVALSGDIRGILETDSRGLVSLVLQDSDTRVSRAQD
jgi:hypothetical protein